MQWPLPTGPAGLLAFAAAGLRPAAFRMFGDPSRPPPAITHDKRVAGAKVRAVLSFIPDHGHAGPRGGEESAEDPPSIVMPAEAGIHGTGHLSNDKVFGFLAPATVSRRGHTGGACPGAGWGWLSMGTRPKARRLPAKPMDAGLRRHDDRGFFRAGD